MNVYDIIKLFLCLEILNGKKNYKKCICGIYNSADKYNNLGMPIILSRNGNRYKFPVQKDVLYIFIYILKDC